MMSILQRDYEIFREKLMCDVNIIMMGQAAEPPKLKNSLNLTLTQVLGFVHLIFYASAVLSTETIRLA